MLHFGPCHASHIAIKPSIRFLRSFKHHSRIAVALKYTLMVNSGLGVSSSRV